MPITTYDSFGDIRQEKGTTIIRVKKEEVIISLFADAITMYLEYPKNKLKLL